MENQKELILEISQSTDIIIYGAAGNGMRGYHSLKRINGYHVIGFIDKRAKEIGTQYGLPVWTPYEDIQVDKSRCVVCICIKNVFEHEMIVNQLIKKGFHFFIFKPIISMNRKNNTKFITIDQNYEKIFCDVDIENQYKLDSVPTIGPISLFEFKDYAIVSETAEDVTSLLPFENLSIECSNSWLECMRDSLGIVNSAALVPHLNLFQLISGNGGNIQEYYSYCVSSISGSEKLYGADGGCIKDTYEWRKSIIKNRMVVFEKMKDSLELNPVFFINHAPRCFFK